MRAVQGVYADGVVSLSGEVEIPDRAVVTVLVPEEGDQEVAPALSFAGMLGDLTPEEEAAFDDAMKRPIRFGRDTKP